MHGTDVDRVPTLQHGAEAGGHRPMKVTTWEEYLHYVHCSSKQSQRKEVMHACLLHHLTMLMTDYEFGTKKKGKKEKGESKTKEEASTSNSPCGMRATLNNGNRFLGFALVCGNHV